MGTESADGLPASQSPPPESGLMLVVDLVMGTGLVLWIVGQCFVMLMLTSLQLLTLGVGSGRVFPLVLFSHLLVAAVGVALVLLLRIRLRQRIAAMALILCLILVAVSPWLVRGHGLFGLLFWFG